MKKLRWALAATRDVRLTLGLLHVGMCAGLCALLTKLKAKHCKNMQKPSLRRAFIAKCLVQHLSAGGMTYLVLAGGTAFSYDPSCSLHRYIGSRRFPRLSSNRHVGFMGSIVGDITPESFLAAVAARDLFWGCHTQCAVTPLPQMCPFQSLSCKSARVHEALAFNIDAYSLERDSSSQTYLEI